MIASTFSNKQSERSRGGMINLTTERVKKTSQNP